MDSVIPPGVWVDDSEDDDPLLRRADGSIVDTWREDFPYAERLDRDSYEHAKRLLQVELLKLQYWVKETGGPIVVLFEGRDAAGKDGTIKRFTEHMDPRGARVMALGGSGRAGARSVVLPAVCGAPADHGRDRHVRPVLVQPRRRRAGDGLLHPAGG
jgi:hypothetical protein